MGDSTSFPDQSKQLELGSFKLREEEPVYTVREELYKLNTWLEEISAQRAFLYIKRLSANDTGATGSHQVGLYLPESVTRNALPSINRKNVSNPDLALPYQIDSQSDIQGEVRAIYYNNRFFGGTRNEARLTRWALPTRTSPLKDPENTGALAVFSFIFEKATPDATSLRVWICNSPAEEELMEREFGQIQPGQALVGYQDQLRGGFSVPSEVEGHYDLPPDWQHTFPAGRDIIEYVFSLSSQDSLRPDERLMKRREMEFQLFKQVELSHVMPLIRSGFQNVDEFIAVANSVANRRKSRSGRSLELHLRKIFEEEGLPAIGEQCVTENKKKPDFLFPDCHAYHNKQFPSDKLRMLGVKTTCKDRWRQILSEALRIESKHLFTLQEGVSVNQYAEMRESKVTLVAPSPIHRKYPKSIRGELLTLEDFVYEIKRSSYS